MPQDSQKDFQKTDAGRESIRTASIATQSDITRFIEGQLLKTNPFGHNISAEQAYRRAERISGALYMVTSHISSEEPLRMSIRKEALTLLTLVLPLRHFLRAEKSDYVQRIQASLRKTISLVRMLGLSGYLSLHNTHILVDALDDMGHLLTTAQRSELSEDILLSRGAVTPLTHERKGRVESKNIARSRTLEPLSKTTSTKGIIKDMSITRKSDINVRSNRILDILRAGGLVGIKDITLNLPEYSEKMVQRELARLVKEGKVRKTGAKRWSRYEIVQ